MSKSPLTHRGRPGRRSRWRAVPAADTDTPGPATPADEHLPVREPQAALSALPHLPDQPSPVNLFGVPAGEVITPCFDLSRLRRIRCTDAPPENTP
jgi:hypothetical protein